MILTNPLALVLLLVIPYILYIGWPRYRFRRRRDISSLLLRTVIMLLLIFGLAGLQVVEAADRLAVIFLVDVSDSVTPTMREQELAFIHESIQAMGPDDEFGVVLFGANAVPERPVSAVRELETIRSTPVSSNTDLAEAIRLGLAMFPANVARRMVILSDGLVTAGDTEAAARLAAATGVELSYVLFAREPLPEVQVTDFHVPTTIIEGQQFDLNLTVDASDPTPATVTVLAGGEIVHTEQVDLRAGVNNYTLSLQSGTAGFKDFLVTVAPAANDYYYQNNQLSTFSTVIGPPSVLVVSPGDDESRYLVSALQEAELHVTVVQPSQLPLGVAALAQYKSVILDNVPAAQLSIQRMEALERYVRDLGGGLVVVGGPDSYGPGGYFQTPLETALPVEMQIKDQQRLPQLTIAYVIDRSGSMGASTPSGATNIDLAKEAMIRSIDFLQPSDRAAVVSFDTVGYWIAQFQPVLDRRGLQRLIASLRSGGGTDILAGMRLVSQDIVQEESQRKHIILLTDGGASPSGLIELARDLYEQDGVTTSVIAIGRGAASFLDDMARAGGGNYHNIEDVNSIPAIFTVETVLATRSYILEEPFVPNLTANSPIMQGINAAPELKGYVATTPKLAAQVILRAPEPFADPVLAAWQYGLGRAVAFTSDATARWGADWVQWANFSRFWGQTVRWTMTEGAANNLEARVVMEDELARLIVDARDEEGAFLNGLDLEVSLIDPKTSQGQRLQLQQVAPGRYEVLFTPTAEGAYFMRLTGTGIVDGAPLAVNQTTGWVLSYSPEYQIDNTGDGELLLREIAELTGGGSLQEAPGDAFLHNIVARNATAPLWPWLLLAAMLLLPFDIAVRRLIVTRTDLQRLRSYLLPQRLVTEGSSERMSTLMSARERARRRTAGEPASAENVTVGGLLERRERARAERDSALRTTTPPPAEAPQPRYKPRLQTEAPADANIGERLLKRRRERESDEG